MPYVELVEGIHELLDGTWNAAQEVRSEFDGAPAAGSKAAHEIANTEEGPGGPWGPEPVRTAYSFVTMANFAAADHLGCLATLITPGGIGGIFGPLVLSRACLEASARCWWIGDPAIDVRTRVERSFATRLRSSDESARLIRELLAGVAEREAKGARNGGRAQLEANLEEQRLRRIEILDQAVARGIPVHTEAGVPRGINVATPSAGKVVGDLLAEAGSTIGGAMYALLSGITHSTYSALLQYFTQVEGGDDETAHMEPNFSDDSLLGTTYQVLSGFMTGFERIIELFGWNEERWAQWTRAARSRALDLTDRLDNTMRPAGPTIIGKVARNALCPCGSGQKFKFCHGRS